MNIKKEILFRVKIAFAFLLVISLAIVYSIFNLQFGEGEYWQSKSENINFKFDNIKASRGNILSDDGSILATSLPFYKVALDPSIASQNLLDENLDSLAFLLSSFFKDKTASQYKNNILTARKNKRRYLLLNRKKIDYQEKKKLASWPIFRDGRLNGGVLFEKKDERFRPFSKLGYRTIGSVDENNKGTVGLEYSFNSYLDGKDGKILTQKLAGNHWMPIYDGSEIQPKNGYDIITTINVNLQDIVESALLKGLELNDADYGSVILMEVKTGEIKAISNFSKNKSGYYTENYNYAIQGMHEPGSTFKLASLLAYIEETNRSVDDSVDTGEGELRFYTEIMKDHKPGGFGKITIKETFEKSSNIGVAMLIDDTFKDKPQKYLNYLKKFGFSDNFNFQIFGSSKPQIKNYSDSTWSKVSLPWIAHGYELMLTPLHTLTFYNAIANGGYYIKPQIVKEVKNANEIIQEFKKSSSEKIATKNSIKTMKSLLEGVVENGTADNIKHSNYKIAGKTGTGQVDYTTDDVQYISSFVGYFPADKPKYSCIVVIHKPNKKMGYYGNIVAAPVFKKIADKIYSLTPKDKKTSRIKQKDLNKIIEENSLVIVDNNFSVIKGKNLKNVLPKLENLGYIVRISGRGNVIKNYKVNSTKKSIEVELI